MEVEAASHPVDVEDLARKMEVRTQLALHRLEGNLFELDAARCHKLFLVGGFPLDLKGACCLAIERFPKPLGNVGRFFSAREPIDVEGVLVVFFGEVAGGKGAESQDSRT